MKGLNDMSQIMKLILFFTKQCCWKIESIFVYCFFPFQISSSAGLYTWTDGTSLGSVTYWAPGQPDNQYVLVLIPNIKTKKKIISAKTFHVQNFLSTIQSDPKAQ